MSSGADPAGSRFLQAGGIGFHYIEAGSGDPPIVLVHGLGSTVTKWRDVLPLLGAHRRTIAVDLPGFGRSGTPRARYTFGFLAGGIRAFLDSAGVERAVVVGNSLGGITAMWLAAAWPERVAGLVMVDAALPLPPGVRPDTGTIARMLASSVPGVGEALYSVYVRRTAPEQMVAEGLARNVADPSRVSQATVGMLREEAAERARRSELRRPLMSVQRHLLWMLSAGRAEVERVAASVRVPTLLLWGSKDVLVPLAVGEHWVGRIPGAELVVLDGAGHNPQLEDAVRFAGVVSAFADSLEPALRLA